MALSRTDVAEWRGRVATTDGDKLGRIEELTR